MNPIKWQNPQEIPSQQYTCWSCASSLASDKGWIAKETSGHPGGYVCICHRCSRPTFVEPNGTQTPGRPFGNPVNDVTDPSVNALYNEARTTMQVSSYTAVVLACRKLMMHIAVDKGAKAGQSFVSYVEYLATQNYIPPDARDWVDHIRQRGNEANHEIVIMTKENAEELIAFCEMLLKLIYEFPAAIKKKNAAPTK